MRQVVVAPMEALLMNITMGARNRGKIDHKGLRKGRERKKEKESEQRFGV